MAAQLRRIKSFPASLALGLWLLGPASPLFVQAQDQDQPLSPYQTALLNYKNSHYDAALTAINDAEKANPSDLRVEVLKARILIEQHNFDAATAVLKAMNGKPGLIPEIAEAQTLAFGDLYLHKRSFDEAAKSYESLLAQKPGDPDLLLKMVYARVGASDYVAAGKYLSELKPLDPVNPSYYFAKAALAQATGNSNEADDDIETSRTIYGLMVTNRYLKTYLEIFASSSQDNMAAALTPPPATNASANLAPPPDTNNAPSGAGKP